MNIESGWLEGVRRIPSPNVNERPPGSVVDLLVVHNISLPPGEFGSAYVEQLFTNCLDCTLHPWFERLRGLTVS
ncbi:MAG: 1,6-anhydro-N-acetylmuramyl-L-alanine amidase AmpD, partial [Pseudomonadales bacterium]